MRLVDSHCHLEMEAFQEDREDVVRRAQEAGVCAMLTVGTDREGAAAAIRIAEEFVSVWAAVGLHPHEARHADETLWQELAGWLDHPRVVALGETGLDYHYDHSPREVQREVFRRHVGLAQDRDVPLVVHSREAEDDTMEILEEAARRGPLRGVLHCFSGGVEMARTAVDMGLFLSVAGPVTFKKAEGLREVLRHVQIEHLLVETDAPYLSPVPHRGKRNEPAFVRHTAAAVAACVGLSEEDVARITTLNAFRLFGIGPEPLGQGTIAYPIRDSLYLNITNRCTNRCGFCAKFSSDFVKGHNLHLDREPSTDEVIAAIGDPRRYREVVFCGYGEPLIRLDLVTAVADWVKARGGRVRVNTNGLAALIHGRDILGDLAGRVDALSVSLDAHDGATYERLCRPKFGAGSFEAVTTFIREAASRVDDVTATVVDAPEVDVEASRKLAESLGARFRLRRLNVVG